MTPFDYTSLIRCAYDQDEISRDEVFAQLKGLRLSLFEHAIESLAIRFGLPGRRTSLGEDLLGRIFPELNSKQPPDAKAFARLAKTVCYWFTSYEFTLLCDETAALMRCAD